MFRTVCIALIFCCSACCSIHRIFTPSRDWSAKERIISPVRYASWGWNGADASAIPESSIGILDPDTNLASMVEIDNQEQIEKGTQYHVILRGYNHFRCGIKDAESEYRTFKIEKILSFRKVDLKDCFAQKINFIPALSDGAAWQMAYPDHKVKIEDSAISKSDDWGKIVTLKICVDERAVLVQIAHSEK